MNLITKLFILTILVSSVISCKLYKKITDNADQVLEKLKNNNESFNTLKSSSGGRKRSGRKPRSADNTYMDQDADKKPLMADIQNDNSSSYPQQVNNDNDSREVKQARNIMTEIDSSKEDCTIIDEDLTKVKANLDKIKSLLNIAKSYLEQARKASSSKANLASLPKLDQAIKNAKSSHASADTHYNDAIAALARAKDSFEYAQRKADQALEEALSNSNASRHESYYYSLYNQFMADAKDAMSSAKSFLETTKNKQEELNDKIPQANEDLEKLNKAYEAALKSVES
ncbi:hypothetical protein F0310_05545 (plasmid) [Borrelia sp. A-FGy1]|uniref:hypothetical protein n=1 Tax=Borrelia sp. A-FGy1 TaxID=2608247 RepID=UPI0015F6F133|nr:hypothetical protein [Borrelia sp. A-FGy1]QMU99874.1 hypothetical protein F0310_05545 [Borrelia sp. A-FGy1]